ncbi:MAG: hypothetical protein CL524_12030 [Aequorivita sp.]|nr:hypothetical protein [Aequorivita sp.]|tara:strand:+ start:427 stop:771 length:345 start_codon:yes stop_codon:yes gene_type:complete
MSGKKSVGIAEQHLLTKGITGYRVHIARKTTMPRPKAESFSAKQRLKFKARKIAASNGKIHVTRPSLPKLGLLYFIKEATPEQLEELIQYMEKALEPKLERIYKNEIEQDLFVT